MALRRPGAKPRAGLKLALALLAALAIICGAFITTTGIHAGALSTVRLSVRYSPRSPRVLCAIIVRTIDDDLGRGRVAALAVLLLPPVPSSLHTSVPPCWLLQVSEAIGSLTSMGMDAAGTAGVDQSRSLQPGKRASRREATADAGKRCVGTVGDWCQGYLLQEEVPASTAPRGNKTCSMDCNKASPDHLLPFCCRSRDPQN